jgi:hypothetical protein
MSFFTKDSARRLVFATWNGFELGLRFVVDPRTFCFVVLVSEGSVMLGNRCVDCPEALNVKNLLTMACNHKCLRKQLRASLPSSYIAAILNKTDGFRHAGLPNPFNVSDVSVMQDC